MTRIAALFAAPALFAANWPEAAGPDHNWTVAGSAPVSWSVVRNQSVAWKTTLPNAGQSGIAVWGDRVYLTTFARGEKGFSGKITGHAVDARSGRILWSVDLEGEEKSPMMYAYSDSTSPTPIADARHVWFTNASGEMGCWTADGKEVWRRKFRPWGKPFPFNKQHEPIRHGDVILNLEPLAGAPPEKQGWNYLHAVDARTGRTRWIAADGTTSYNTAVFGTTADGVPAVMHGRGGYHDVPEVPVGLSLMSLRPADAGKSIWRFVAGNGTEGGPTWQALYNSLWDRESAYWFRLNPEESHIVIDAKTGALRREQSLIRGVDYRQWDPAASRHIEHRGVNLREVRELSPRAKLAEGEVIRVFPAWFSNIVVNGYHWFLTSTAHRRNRQPPKGRAGPSHCVARVHIASGKVEYLELPVTVVRRAGEADRFVYGEAVLTKTENADGVDPVTEARSRMDGWETPAFWGNPVAVGGVIYWTTSLGITYAVDAKATVLDARALLSVNDLGPSGETWSLTTPAYSSGRIYHRTAKELIAIGR